MIAGDKENVTGLPLNVVHTVRGSVPRCSFVVVAPEAVAGTGNVTGTGTLQVFAFALTVTAVIAPLVIVYDIFG